MKFTSLLFFILTSIPLFASTEFVGNGGDVVVCPKGSPFRVKLLDVYEEQTFNPDFRFDLGDSHLSLQEKVQFHIKKLETQSPYRFRRYDKDWSEFLGKVFWVTDKEDLTEIPDSLNLPLLPENCKLAQIALQLKKDNNQGYRYLIVKSLWDQLPVEEKVALIFHEIIYKEVIEFGHNDSIEVRKLNTMILDKSFRDFDHARFQNHIKNIGLPVETSHGVYPGPYQYEDHYPSGNTKLAVTDQASKLFVGKHYLELPKGVRIHFYDNSKNTIKQIVHYLFVRGEVSGYVQIDGENIKVGDLKKSSQTSDLILFEMNLDEEAMIQSIRVW